MYRVLLTFNSEEKAIIEQYFKSHRQYKRLEHLKKLILDGLAETTKQHD